MPIRKFEIEAEIPEGYEPTGEFRPVRSKEPFIDLRGLAQVAQVDYLDPGDHPRIILRREWKWPEWIKPGCWIAANSKGKWWLYDREPYETTACFSCDLSGHCMPLGDMTNFTPPPLTDWRKSKRQRPA